MRFGKFTQFVSVFYMLFALMVVVSFVGVFQYVSNWDARGAVNDMLDEIEASDLEKPSDRSLVLIADFLYEVGDCEVISQADIVKMLDVLLQTLEHALKKELLECGLKAYPKSSFLWYFNGLSELEKSNKISAIASLEKSLLYEDNSVVSLARNSNLIMRLRLALLKQDAVALNQVVEAISNEPISDFRN